MRIISEYHVEGPKHFITFDPKSDRIFVSNNVSNSVHMIDLNTDTVERIELESPRDLICSSNFNRLYVLSGKQNFRNRGTSKKISVVDLYSNTIVKEITANGGFGGMALNSKQDKIYIAIPKKRTVLKIDENTLENEKELNVKYRCAQIIFNENTDELILAGRSRILRRHIISRFDENSNKMKKILNMSDGLYNFLKIKFYPKTNVILAHLDNTAAGTYAGGSNSLYILKYDKPNTKSHFRDDEVSTKNDFDLDETKKKHLLYHIIYCRHENC